MRYIIKEEVGSVYWYDGKDLMFAPLCKDGSFDTDDGGCVDKAMVGDEIYQEQKTLNDLYLEVEAILK